jgi:hypothetical protein
MSSDRRAAPVDDAVDDERRQRDAAARLIVIRAPGCRRTRQ